MIAERLQGHGLELSAARLVPLTLVCMFPTDRSHFILETAAEPDASAAWAPASAAIIRTTIRVQEHGSERLFVASSTNLGSALCRQTHDCTRTVKCAVLFTCSPRRHSPGQPRACYAAGRSI